MTELFDHTADLGLECTGASMTDLLERAGEAFLPKRLAGVSIGDRSVSCRVDGEPRDPERHAPIREIKAVTYHDVTIEKSRGMLTARAVLDV